jgi:hypothetical protein
MTDTKGNAMKIVTLAEAMAAAPEDVRADRARADQQFGVGLFDQAVAHHTNLCLRANVTTGTTQNKYGEASRFTHYELAYFYEAYPHHIWNDFFSGTILNSCSRMARGLKP